MSFEAREFYTFALQLVKDNAPEVAIRTAISRAYYAVHLIARARLFKKGWWEPTGRGDDHGRLIHALRQKQRARGESLNLLRRYREHADYHLESSDSPFNKECEFCEELRKTPSVPQVVVTQNHWKDVQENCERLLRYLETL